jgi:hypothetical protein
MKKSTLHEFGFKPRSKMKKKSSSASVAASTCSSSAVAKIPDRTDAYKIDDQSFKTPPCYIKKERPAWLERKAKSNAIKKLNKRKKEETKKKRWMKSMNSEKIVLRSTNGWNLRAKGSDLNMKGGFEFIETHLFLARF